MSLVNELSAPRSRGMHGLRFAAVGMTLVWLALPAAASAACDLQTDGDCDGVSNAIEDGHPNQEGQTGKGDGNHDEVPDSIQDFVVSYPVPEGMDTEAGYITLITDNTCAEGERRGFEEVNPQSEEQLEAPDPDYDYPFGLVSFEIGCSGSQADVIVVFHPTGGNGAQTAVGGGNSKPRGRRSAQVADGAAYRKYGPDPVPQVDGGPGGENRWFTLEDAEFGQAEWGDDQVRFTLVDGEPGDDLGGDFRLRDPGGLGIPPPPPVPGLPAWAAVALLTALAVAGGWRLRLASDAR